MLRHSERFSSFRRWFGLLLLLVASPTLLADETAADDSKEQHSVLKRSGFAPTFSLHGFSDASFIAEDIDPDSGDGSNNNHFAIGELDLYMVSQLTDQFSFLGELVFEFDDDGAEIDIERVFLKYSRSDLFWISIGRRHTPLGYWNQQYHHGLLLQPTIERPSIVKFEDQGGVLPIHAVGLQSGGRVYRNAWGLDYSAVVANGRGLDRESVQNSSDLNNSKALAFRLSLVREKESKFEFGPTLYIDEIPADPGTVGREGGIDEQIWGAHLAWNARKVQLLGEYFKIRHEDQLTSIESEHSGYYGVLVWKQWKWKPYVSVDRLELDAGDPYFADVTDEDRFIVGARFDPNPFLALKFEYPRERPTGADLNGLAVQVAYTF